MAAAQQNVASNTKEATEFCKTLYNDPRLDPLRGVTTFDAAPSLSMQSNASYITEEQRPALDAFEGLFMQCRQKIAAANPILSRIMVQVDPSPTEELKSLYDGKITWGQYNTHRQELLDKLQAAVAGTNPH
ncbi:MAG TPA: hypothetical protein VFA50_15835 [Stellaceae bacterium]|nr:hypothetical protein [Stellaceae bacterium]